MNDLKQLIRQYPELGDVFADLETRLLFLENSLPYPAKDTGQLGEPKGEGIHYHFRLPHPPKRKLKEYKGIGIET